MILPQIETYEQVTDAQVAYLTGLAQTLATQSDFNIQNFADSSVTSPDVQSILQSESAVALLAGAPPAGAAFDIFNPTGGEDTMFALSLQQDSIFTGLWDSVKGLFTSFRAKVKHIFCQVVAALGSDEDLDLKKIIRDVLIVLIPAFAATAGLASIALPIVVSLAAMLLKYGISQVCPV